MIFDGLQAHSINIGNNRLFYLVIRDCPNLVKLRYAHNLLVDGDAFIDWDSCRNLKPENIDKFNCDGKHGAWAQLSLAKIESGELMGNEKFNQELKKDKQNLEIKQKNIDWVKAILTRIENQESIPFKDFLDIFKDSSVQTVLQSLDEKTSQEFRTVFIPRLETHAQDLINNYEQMTKEKFEEEYQKIETFLIMLSPELQNKLTRLAKGEQLEIIANQNIRPWLIGLGTMVLMTAGIIFYLTNRMIKKLLVKY
ncbi:MAG: hypothetical protein mread185_000071 [Mycoplasmataceae bacterium]|nr:MAG: hypothetical protein mread185_000071 [Mycoplasmataceae bacterium]